MDEFSRLGCERPTNAVEVVSKRCLVSKTFALPDGKMNFQTSGQLLHYEENGQILDIDLEPIDCGEYWEVNKAPYILRVWKNTPKTYFLDKASGYEVNMSTGLQSAGTSRICDRGHEFVFKGLFDGILSVIAIPAGVITQTIVNSGTYSLAWSISQNQSDPKILETNINARDAEGNNAEVLIERSPLVSNGKIWEGSFKETFTGKTLQIEAKTRVRSVGGDAVYPVTIIT